MLSVVLVSTFSKCVIFVFKQRVPAFTRRPEHLVLIRFLRFFRDVEILVIMQAHSWKLASLDEFRKFFKPVPHKTFEGVNPDPYVAGRLKRLYDHPDFVELYPGLVEDAKYQ